MKNNLIAMLVVVVIFVFLLGLSWAFTCGIIKLITMCFGWMFSLKIATGIWLMILLINYMLCTGNKE